MYQCLLLGIKGGGALWACKTLTPVDEEWGLSNWLCIGGAVKKLSIHIYMYMCTQHVYTCSTHHIHSYM